MKKIIIGLTGGLGSGKSTALGIFKKWGATTICCDTLAHEALLKTSPVYAAIVKRFGNRILSLNKEIRRDVLGARVFENPALRRALEKLIHPYVRRRVEEEIKKAKTQIVVVDIPLLFEVKRARRYSPIVTVYTPLKARLSRLEKKGITRRDALLKMKTQMSLEKKASRSDVVLYNTTPEALKKQIRYFLNSLNLKRPKRA
jgi:dephospho-CoA kinase